MDEIETDSTNETPAAEPEKREVPAPEAAMAKQLLKQIEQRLETTEQKRHIKQITKNREYARGEQENDDEEGLVRANIIHPELKKAQNECYAKNPEASIKPTESVSKDRYETWKKTGKTMELVVNNQFSPAQADLKAKAKRAVRSADTTGFGWLKVIYQKHIERDPIVQKRMQDVQDNIQEIDRLQGELRKGKGDEGEDDHELLKEKLTQQLNSLEEKVEVVRTQGLSIAVRPSENILFSEEAQDPDDIKNCDWIADQFWIRVDRVKAMFGFCPDEATKYNERKADAKEAAKTLKPGDSADSLLLKVYEVWNMVDKRIYTVAEGYEGYLKEPYTPDKVGERFYGFFPLVFDPVDGSAYPNPLVSQLIELQDEHNTARTNFREHREKAVPFNVAHGSDLDSNDVENLTNPAFMETVVLKSAPTGQPLDSVFKSVQHPPLDPSVYNTDHVRQDWEQITRRGDAARGTIARSKTATEADILQSNLAVDTSERRDVVEDWFQEVAQYSLELCLQEMSKAEVARIAGQEAAQYWPELSKNEVFDMVQVDVRVGSSGKPNAGQEMEKWLKMLPQFRESLLAIVTMKADGKDDQAEIMTKLLRETIERFEERIDLDALLPQDDEGQQDPAKAQAQKMQQMQFAMQMKEMISNIANTDADTMNKIADAEAKEIGPQMQIYMTILQGLLNKQQPQQQPASGSLQ